MDNDDSNLKQNENLESEYEQQDKENFKLLEFNLTSSSNIISNKLEDLGYGQDQIASILVCSIALTFVGMEGGIIEYLYISLRDMFHIEPFYLRSISSAMPMGSALGSLLLGLIMQKLTRKQCVITVCIIYVFLHLIYTFYFFPITLFICRFGIGICNGILIPILFNVLSETLPVKQRSVVLSLIWVSVLLGSLLVVVFIYLIMPNFESTKLMTVLVLIWFYIFLGSILIIFLFKDSIRSIFIKNEKKGFRLLKQVLTQSGLSTDNIKLADLKNYYSKMLGDYEMSGSTYKLIFNEKYRGLTLRLLAIFFLFSLAARGSVITFPLTIEYIFYMKNGRYSNGQSVLEWSILLPISIIIGAVISSIALQLKSFSIKTFMNGLVILAFVLSIFTAIFFRYFQFIFLFFIIFSFSCFFLAYGFTGGCYPAKMKDTAIGMLSFCESIGSIFSTYVFVSLFRFNPRTPYYLLICLLFVLMILIISLPSRN